MRRDNESAERIVLFDGRVAHIDQIVARTIYLTVMLL
jgi:hypothetical protein